MFVNGISGDETSHALYRLSHGAFPRTTVDDIVMMIGTNNFGRAYREYWDAKKIHAGECLNEEQVRAIDGRIPAPVAGVLAVIVKDSIDVAKFEDCSFRYFTERFKE